MTRKRIVKALIILAVIAAVVGGGWWATGYMSQSYAEKQVTSLLEGDHDALYNSFSPELQNQFTGAQDFFDKFAGTVYIEPIKSTEYKGKTGGLSKAEYTFHLVREDNEDIGYAVNVEVSGLLGKKTSNISVQEVQFLEN